jgi:hypothetical protein
MGQNTNQDGKNLINLIRAGDREIILSLFLCCLSLARAYQVYQGPGSGLGPRSFARTDAAKEFAQGSERNPEAAHG